MQLPLEIKVRNVNRTPDLERIVERRVAKLVKNLLAVRAWWTESVVEWIAAGRRGETPVTPAEGYSWPETPRLNADIVRAAGSQSFGQIKKRLERGVSEL